RGQRNDGRLPGWDITRAAMPAFQHLLAAGKSALGSADMRWLSEGLIGNMQHRLDIGPDPVSSGQVSLVDRVDVPNFHDPGLGRLDRIAKPGHRYYDNR